VHKPVLVVTTHFMDEIEARIDRDYDARRIPHERPFTRDELIEASSGADALFITPLDRLDSGFFKRVSASVKVIAAYSVGIDHIDLQAAANRTVAIAYTPGIQRGCHRRHRDVADPGCVTAGVRRPGNGAYRNMETF
jgi:lactate dehydrogenase-like 2-hydroxyacid dehydrogenase